MLVDHNNFGKICGFVEQNSLFFEYLTPKELLWFGTKLKLKLGNAKIEEKVKFLLKQVFFSVKKFGLESCAETYISKLSGGEKKRVLIGI